MCKKYSLDELVSLDEYDMNRLLQHYKDGTVPLFGIVHGEIVYIFDGSFGWHC